MTYNHSENKKYLIQINFLTKLLQIISLTLSTNEILSSDLLLQYLALLHNLLSFDLKQSEEISYSRQVALSHGIIDLLQDIEKKSKLNNDIIQQQIHKVCKSIYDSLMVDWY